MIIASRPLQALCLLLAASIHVVAFTLCDRTEHTQLAAAGPVAEAKTGSSFADMAAGVVTPMGAVTTAATPVNQTLTARETVSLTLRAAMPGITPVAPPEKTPISQAGSAIASSPTVITTPKTAEIVARTAPKTAPTVAPSRTLTAVPEPDRAPTLSMRPTNRPPDLAAPAAASPAGNSNRDAVAGASNRVSQGTARQSGSNAATAQSATQSNAAASNYRGEVLRRISSVRRPRTNARGVAVVSFSIAANGSLASIGVLRSSGDRDLDRLAQRVIRQAAPFPAPPPGADRTFQFEIQGR